jgi:hypothetical protein
MTDFPQDLDSVCKVFGYPKQTLSTEKFIWCMCGCGGGGCYFVFLPEDLANWRTKLCAAKALQLQTIQPTPENKIIRFEL